MKMMIGGDMAMIHTVAFSSRVSGVAVIAGAPYGCNAIVEKGREHACGAPAPGHGPDNPRNYARIEDYLKRRNDSGVIDPLEVGRHAAIKNCLTPCSLCLQGLQGKPAWLFHGTADSLVYPAIMRACAQQVRALNMSVETEFGVAAEHGMVVDGRDFPFPGSFFGCQHYGEPFIVNCDYDMSRAFLASLYPTLQPLKPMRAASVSNVVRLNQTRYAPGHAPQRHGLGRAAYVYVPTDCRQNVSQCKLHVHYHGCGGAVANDDLSALFWLELPHLAEANDIVILYPQACRDTELINSYQLTSPA